MSKKEILIDIINGMSEDDSNKFYEVFSALYTGMPLKLAEALKMSLKSCDSAVPQSWFDKVQELGINPRPFYWSYQDESLGGKALNLNEELLNKLFEFFRNV